jgi:hypothetical protein
MKNHPSIQDDDMHMGEYSFIGADFKTDKETEFDEMPT